MTRLIRLPEVLHLTGLKRASIYSYMHTGKFPPPIPLGARAVAWEEGAVQEWIERRVAESGDRVLVAISKAAEEMGIPPEDLEMYVESGGLPTVTIGKQTMIRRAVMADFQKQQDRHGRAA